MLTMRGLQSTLFASVIALPACSGDSNTGPAPGPPPPPPAPITGSIRVVTTTTGDDFDLSAYLVSIGEDVRLIEWNAGVAFGDLAARDYTVTLSDVAENCSVSGDASREVSVTAGSTTEVAFDVSCAALPPAEVDVTGSWSGEFEGTDNVAGGSGSGTLTYELVQDGDDVSGTLIGDEATYSVEGRVSGSTVTLFFLGWTRPATGYRHRVTNAGEVNGSVMAGTSVEQRSEWTGTFRVVRQ